MPVPPMAMFPAGAFGMQQPPPLCMQHMMLQPVGSAVLGGSTRTAGATVLLQQQLERVYPMAADLALKFPVRK